MAIKPVRFAVAQTYLVASDVVMVGVASLATRINRLFHQLVKLGALFTHLVFSPLLSIHDYKPILHKL